MCSATTSRTAGVTLSGRRTLTSRSFWMDDSLEKWAGGVWRCGSLASCTARQSPGVVVTLLSSPAGTTYMSANVSASAVQSLLLRSVFYVCIAVRYEQQPCVVEEHRPANAVMRDNRRNSLHARLCNHSGAGLGGLLGGSRSPPLSKKFHSSALSSPRASRTRDVSKKEKSSLSRSKRERQMLQ
jgi:hypothetical protein